MSYRPAVVLIVALATLLSGCAMGQRRAQLQQTLQFENVDTNSDGVISPAEWEAMKSKLSSRR